ncbi:uncharacterized protein [Lolium perenne]|uniref:uncharacterized protein n=1 Tax=Lolium perenne TaxID=4522 RepID=UPI0021F66707|nr:uncharacterized protein LOC127334905 [Lolium perenne]
MRRRSGTTVAQPDQEQQLRPLRRNQDASHVHQNESHGGEMAFPTAKLHHYCRSSSVGPLRGARRGGSDLSGNKRTNKEQSSDQKFEKMNVALRLSFLKGYPVRVIW